jgi:hypothetical protein
VKNCPKGLRL